MTVLVVVIVVVKSVTFVITNSPVNSPTYQQKIARKSTAKEREPVRAIYYNNRIPPSK